MQEPDEERILHPGWEFYERHLQRPAPAARREIYADSGQAGDHPILTASFVAFFSIAFSTLRRLDFHHHLLLVAE